MSVDTVLVFVALVHNYGHPCQWNDVSCTYTRTYTSTIFSKTYWKYCLFQITRKTEHTKTFYRLIDYRYHCIVFLLHVVVPTLKMFKFKRQSFVLVTFFCNRRADNMQTDVVADPKGVTRPKFGYRGVPPGPWNPDPVYDEKFVKILKNRHPVYDFQVKFHSFFLQNF